MKRFSILFVLLCVFVFTSCEEDEIVRCGETFGEVEASALDLVELPMTSLSAGLYPAKMGDKKLFVAINDGKAKWVIPLLDDGTYTLSINGRGTRYKAIVHVVPSDGGNY